MKGNLFNALLTSLNSTNKTQSH